MNFLIPKITNSALCARSLHGRRHIERVLAYCKVFIIGGAGSVIITLDVGNDTLKWDKTNNLSSPQNFLPIVEIHHHKRIFQSNNILVVDSSASYQPSICVKITQSILHLQRCSVILSAPVRAHRFTSTHFTKLVYTGLFVNHFMVLTPLLAARSNCMSTCDSRI